MKEKIKALISLILVFVLSFSFSLFLGSCEFDRSYDEQEVITAAEKLIKNTEILNTVYYGNGISFREMGYSNGAYSEADSLHLYALGFDTIDGLKELTESTYTVGYSLQLYETVLSSIVDEDNLYTMARYYQSYDTEDPTKPQCIMVYRNYQHIFEDRMTFLYDTLKVSRVKKQKVYVTVQAQVQNKDGDSQTVDIEVALIEESTGWRIDGPTWANFNETLGKYEELTKNDK